MPHEHFNRSVVLPIVAGFARWNDVRRLVPPALRDRHHMVDRHLRGAPAVSAPTAARFDHRPPLRLSERTAVPPLASSARTLPELVSFAPLGSLRGLASDGSRLLRVFRSPPLSVNASRLSSPWCPFRGSSLLFGSTFRLVETPERLGVEALGAPRCGCFLAVRINANPEGREHLQGSTLRTLFDSPPHTMRTALSATCVNPRRVQSLSPSCSARGRRS